MNCLHTHRNRRASALWELLLGMSACTVVLALAGVLLHRGMIVQMQSRSRTNVERTSLRLANNFRSDVHAASDAKPDNAHNNSGVFLHLTVGDRLIDYSRENGNVLRVESGGNLPPRREVFEFPAAARLAIEQLNTPARLAMTIQLRAPDRPPTPSDISIDLNPTQVSLHVEAAVGRDLQLRHPPANTEASR